MSRKGALAIFVLAALAIGSCSRAPEPGPFFPNARGWSWQVEPQPAVRGGQLIVNGMVVLFDAWKDGVRTSAVYFDSLGTGVYQFRAVAFDSSLRRCVTTLGGGASSAGVSMKTFLFPADSMPWKRVRYVGIERLSTDSMRIMIAPEAFRRLRELGKDALPYPEIGKAYSFELRSLEGALISSKNLSGKVVLLDFWASWCTPCMALLPDLERVYGKLKGRGFSVIGINLDQSLEKAREVSRKENLPWPVVLAPTNNEERELWEQAAGITTIPRLWLIDRKGVLRADVSPSALTGEIEKLVAE